MIKELKSWKMAVIGSGTMGTTIAQHFASQGSNVTLYDLKQEFLNTAKEQIENNLQTLVSLDFIKKEDIIGILDRIAYRTDLETTVRGADVVFECVPELVEIKRDVFTKLNLYCDKNAYICSNTSGIDIYKFVKVENPGRLIITHFYNPAYVMPLVEIVCGPETSQETTDTVRELMIVTGKKPIVLNKCVPGFIGNRLTVTIAREALYMVENGWVTFDDIDTVITTTFGPRYSFEGIFGLYDNVGIDVDLAVADYIIPYLCNGTKPSKILYDLVEKGELGIKSGKGIRNYAGKDIKKLRRQRDLTILKNLKYIQSLNLDS